MYTLIENFADREKERIDFSFIKNKNYDTRRQRRIYRQQPRHGHTYDL